MKAKRQAQLVELLRDHSGRQVELAKTLRKSAAQINHWLNGHKAISEASAREIEQNAKKPRGWMDGPSQPSERRSSDATASPLPDVSLQQLRRMGPPAQEFVSGMVSQLSRLLEGPGDAGKTWRSTALELAATVDLQQGSDAFTQFCIAVDQAHERSAAKSAGSTGSKASNAQA